MNENARHWLLMRRQTLERDRETRKAKYNYYMDCSAREIDKINKELKEIHDGHTKTD